MQLYKLYMYLVSVLLESLGNGHMGSDPNRGTHNVDGFDEERIPILSGERERERIIS